MVCLCNLYGAMTIPFAFLKGGCRICDFLFRRMNDWKEEETYVLDDESEEYVKHALTDC